MYLSASQLPSRRACGRQLGDYWHDKAGHLGQFNRTQSTLGQAAAPTYQTVNPYPNGIKVAGTGPGGTAVAWRVGYHLNVGLWMADTGFGVAPIYKTVADMQRLTGPRYVIPIYREPHFMLYGFPAFADLVLEGFNTPLPVQPLHVGMDMRVLTHDGGQQYIWYRHDTSTGYWIPTAAQGTGPHSSNLFQTLVIAGAIVVAAVATCAVIGPACTAVAVQAAGYVGTAASAAGAVKTIVSIAHPAAAPAPAPTVIVPVATPQPAVTSPLQPGPTGGPGTGPGGPGGGPVPGSRVTVVGPTGTPITYNVSPTGAWTPVSSAPTDGTQPAAVPGMQAPPTAFNWIPYAAAAGIVMLMI